MLTHTLRILSYNIHKGFNATNRRFVLEVIRDALRLVQPDLVFLQEVVGKNDRHAGRIEKWPLGPQFEFLADQQWPHFAYGRNAVYRLGHHGNAILSKFPLAGWDNVDISQHQYEQRGLLHAELILESNVRLFSLCTHLGLFNRDRVEQVRLICQWISENVPNDSPLVLAGDFNDWRERAGVERLHNLGLNEVFHTARGRYAKTFPALFPVFPLDRVYIRGGSVRMCETLTGAPWNRLSDHLALVAEVEFS